MPEVVATEPVSSPNSPSARCDTPSYDGGGRLCEAWRDTRSALHSSSTKRDEGHIRRLEAALAIVGDLENSSSEAQTTRLPPGG